MGNAPSCRDPSGLHLHRSVLPILFPKRSFLPSVTCLVHYFFFLLQQGLFILLQYLPGQIQVADRTPGFSIIQNSWFPKTGCFAEFDVPLDDGFKNHLLKMLAYFIHHLVREPEPRIIHSQQEAFNLQIGIQTSLDNIIGVVSMKELLNRIAIAEDTKDPADIGRFVTPSLWDIGQTAPYMHSGVFATLEEVVDFYDAGGGGGAGLSPLGLSDADKADLVAFLQSLTGDPPNIAEPDLPDYQLRELGEN